LAPYGAKARLHPDGIIDLSVGTPVDPTPEFIQEALRNGSNAPGYPLTAGSQQLREAIRSWATQKLGASGDFDVLPLIGSKELVAWLPTFLESTRVLYPDIAYPTYQVGALLARASDIPVGVDPHTWPEADLAWVNSPSNPTGRIHSVEEFRATLEWARNHNCVLASDECYLEFGHNTTPISILSQTDGDNTNVLVVHSLSKRSNLAGYRAGFLIGDSALIGKIREVRKHAGMIVPAPVQKAMIAALSDDQHVVEQRNRYNLRREKLLPVLTAHGFEIEESRAGLYIWCTRKESAWNSVDWLADLGILATPGTFYGAKGANHIRIALTATDSEINEAVIRLSSAADTSDQRAVR
jgi:succinyldiaminopimelate transaminase